jgi:hypothetical protein
LCLEDLDVHLGQQLALLDEVALLHAHVDDAARVLGGDVVLRRLDAAVPRGEARGQARQAQPVEPVGGDGEPREK